MLNKVKGGNNKLDSQQARIIKKQSNHDDYYLPRCLSHLNNPPLYLAVAHWGLIKKDGMSREDISQAFRISPRRAADIMNYIYNDRQAVITSQKTVTTCGRGLRSFRLTIMAVGEVRSRPIPNPGKRRVTQAETPAAFVGPMTTVQQLRRWFLTRPNVPTTD